MFPNWQVLGKDCTEHGSEILEHKEMDHNIIP